MIVALALWLLALLGGGAASPFGQTVDRVAERVEDAVHDRSRRKAALTVLDRMQRREQALENILADQTKLLAKQASGYATGSEDVRASTLQAREAMQSARAELLSMRFELTGHLTAEEWQAIFPAP